MSPVKKPFVPGDLVLVAFPGCGYWPCQITAILKHGRREVKCFGEDTTGKAFPKNMVHYNQNTKAKYISKSTSKTYPHLAEALKQIETCKENAVNKTMENKKSKQINGGTKGILKETIIENCNKLDTFAKTGIRCQNQNVKEAALDVEEPEEMVEGDDSEITCVGVSGSLGFIKRMAMGDKEMALPVKIESGSAMENGSCQREEVIKREIGNEGIEGDINVDETGTGSDDEFDFKIKVELDSEVGDFGSGEMDAIEAESQNNTNPNVQSNSSESTNGMSNASAASDEDDSESRVEEEPFIEPRASGGNEANKETGAPKSSHREPDVQPPFSLPDGGDPENDNEIVKVTTACEMPLNVFARFMEMFMEAASHSKTPPVVNIQQK